ncbi:MAG: membrane protein insertion efficiency factor YidD [Bacteroidetes bacterium GWA2_31_9b]|nr:MAG: membrane protein insertion efficiency factor YidD [Bacteroidetes bacterium GWA2_31_9b]
MLGLLKKIVGYIFLIPIYFYKWVISPYTPASCRHTPTCSQYAVDAIKMYGPFTGGLLSINRISRCHPWGTHGYDPVPKILVKKYKPFKKGKYSVLNK